MAQSFYNIGRSLLVAIGAPALIIAASGCSDQGFASETTLATASDTDDSPATPAPNVVASNHNWGGLDSNLYRGANYSGRTRLASDTPTPKTEISVSPDMSTAAIEAAINDAPSGAQINLAAGRYRLTEQLNIERSDITIVGAGMDQTIFDVSAAVFQNVNAIRVRPATIAGFGSWSASRREYKAVTNTTGAVDGQATQVTLQDASRVEPGDFLFFYIERSGPHVRRGTDYFYNGIAEVASVDGSRVNLLHKVGINYNPNGSQVRKSAVHVVDREDDMLHNVILSDFTIDYGEPREASDPHRFYNHADQYIGNELAGDGVRGIFVTNTHESDIRNVRVRNAGAMGISIFNSVEASIDNFVFDGAQNLGAGGVGYGLELLNSYYGDYQNLRTTDAPNRHFIVYHLAGTSAFNNVHVSYTNSNVDFHGGPDHSNIYYVEEAVLFAKDDYASPIMDYRHPQNEEQNTAVFDKAYAAPDGTIDYQPTVYGPARGFPGENNGHRYAVDRRASPVADIVYASNNGAEINTYGKEDTVHGGAGDDVITLGADSDTAYIYSSGGADVITDFNTGQDNLGFQRNINGQSVGSAQDVIQRAQNIEGGVLIDLGGGHQLTLQGVSREALNGNNVFVF